MTVLNIIFISNQIHVYIAIFFVILFITFTSFISACEIAYFSLSPSKIKYIKDKKSKSSTLILRQLNNSELLLATILIANTFFNISIVVFSTYIGSNLKVSVNPVYGSILQVVILTFIILFFGEILPKVYATHYSSSVLKIMAYPILFLEIIFYPISSILILSTSFIVKFFISDKQDISIKELQHAIDLVSDDLNEDEKILKGIVKFRNIDVKEIMKNRTQVITVDIKDAFTKVLSVVNEKGYSRIPVITQNFDNVNGILYIKDLLPHIHKNNTFRWQSLIRPAYFIPETKKINDLLKEIQSKKNHIAVVVDEYGGTSGIITLEDILEEIVGDIDDEDENNYIKIDENNYIFNGTILLNDFYKIINLNENIFEDIKGDADTLAGIILELKGFIPQKKDVILYKNLIFKIKSVDDRRIKQIIVTISDKK